MVFDYSSKILKTAAFIGVLCLFVGSAVAARSAHSVQSGEDSALDLKSIPISDWLNAGEAAEVPWEFRVADPYLRIDQRLEVSYVARISARDLNRTGKTHELFFVSRVSSNDGEWLEQPNIARRVIEEELPRGTQAEFFMRVCVQPGDYLLWLVPFYCLNGKNQVDQRGFLMAQFLGHSLAEL